MTSAHYDWIVVWAEDRGNHDSVCEELTIFGANTIEVALEKARTALNIYGEFSGVILGITRL